MDAVLEQILALPDDWIASGSLRPRVLAQLAQRLAERPVLRSAETGTGKSTLVFSHGSAEHLVFTKDDCGDGDSLRSVQESPFLRRERVRFVIGPAQATLASHAFDGPLDAVLIDGAHAFPFPQLDYYHLYPHLRPGALLVVDDVHLRSVNDLFRVLRDDAMFDLLEVVHTTAFFRRTAAPCFDPLGEGWWEQHYNGRVLPLPRGLSPMEMLKAAVPFTWKERLRAWKRTYVPVARRGPSASVTP